MFAQTLTTRGRRVSLALAVVFCFALVPFWIGGSLEALRGDGRLVRHTLPHYVAFPPQGDLLQKCSNNTQDGLGDCVISYAFFL